MTTAKVYEHGTHARYVLNKCRCDECRGANRDYERASRHRLEPAYVGAGPAREHVAELMAAGVGLKQIAKVSGVPHGTLSKLIYGMRDRAPSKRVRKATQDRLLAVSPADTADGAKVDAAPSWQLIDEMLAAGVPKVRVAEQLGQRGPGLQLGRRFVSGRNARAIADLHARWRSSRVELVKHDRYGRTYVATPPPSERGQADISDLLLELAELVEARNEQPWLADAACRGRPAYLWFPARGDTITARHALQICGACMVRNECRAANIDQPVGIYAGMSAKARRELRREGSQEPAPHLPSPIDHGTDAGYHAHRRAGEDACAQCLRAHADRQHFTRPSRALADAS